MTERIILVIIVIMIKVITIIITLVDKTNIIVKLEINALWMGYPIQKM